MSWSLWKLTIMCNHELGRVGRQPGLGMVVCVCWWCVLYISLRLVPLTTVLVSVSWLLALGSWLAVVGSRLLGVLSFGFKRQKSLSVFLIRRLESHTVISVLKLQHVSFTRYVEFHIGIVRFNMSNWCFAIRLHSHIRISRLKCQNVKATSVS